MVRGGQPALEGGGPAGRDGRKSYDTQETRRSLLESGMVTCRGKHMGPSAKGRWGGTVQEPPLNRGSACSGPISKLPHPHESSLAGSLVLPQQRPGA